MKPKPSLSILALSSLLGIATGIGAYSLNTVSQNGSHDTSNAESKSSSAGAKPSSERPTRSPHVTTVTTQQTSLPDANLALKLAKQGDPAYAEAFLDNLVGLHGDDRDFILGNLHRHFFDNPDQYFDFVKTIAFLDYERNPSGGLDLISAFPREARIRDVERHLLADWVAKDSSSLFSLLEHRADAEQIINDSQLFQLTAIYGQEQAENFTDFVDWANSLEGEAGRNLQWACYQALSQLTPKDKRELIYKETLKKSYADARFSAFPANLIEQHTRDAPDEAQQWLETMRTGPAKALSLDRFLSAVAEYHPQVGADLMNRETFLDEFAIGWVETEEGEVIANDSTAISQEERERFYDNALAHFLGSTLNTAPELVLESAEAFYDEEHRVDFQNAAIESMERISAIPDETGSHHACSDPNCQHHPN